MKKILILIALLCSGVISCFAASGSACPKVPVWPHSKPNFNLAIFCNVFNESAYCHCAGNGLPYNYCKNTLKMKGIYKRMLDKFHSIENACQKGQSDIPTTDCIDEWKYYLSFCQMPSSE